MSQRKSCKHGQFNCLQCFSDIILPTSRKPALTFPVVELDPEYALCMHEDCDAPATVAMVAKFYEMIEVCDAHVMPMLRACEKEFVHKVEFFLE